MVLTVKGVATPFAEAAEDEIRREILRSVRGTALQMQRAVRLITRDRFASQALAVAPGGLIEVLSELDRADAIPAPTAHALIVRVPTDDGDHDVALIRSSTTAPWLADAIRAVRDK